MPAPPCPDEEFIALYRAIGPRETARRLGQHVRTIHARRADLENRLETEIRSPIGQGGTVRPELVNAPGRLDATIEDGIAVIASDAHYWPGEPSTAHRALVKFCREYRPKLVVMNGDVFDGATISRHPPIGWEKRPTVKQELEVVADRLGEITVAADKARRVWTLGNHDARFETRLAMNASEYAGVNGVHLHDHFSDWERAWTLFINESVVVKHRYKGGIHATHNNTLWAGLTVVTLHLHSLKVTPFDDYNGTRFGVDTGTLADTYGPQTADYTELNPVNWRSGFAVLTFRDGELLWPELVHVIRPGQVQFRGKVHAV